MNISVVHTKELQNKKTGPCYTHFMQFEFSEHFLFLEIFRVFHQVERGTFYRKFMKGV